MTYIFIHEQSNCARALCTRLRAVVAGVNTSR
jgi:hypothetical protein